jgi:acyl carrier protein phosphodiesterase
MQQQVPSDEAQSETAEQEVSPAERKQRKGRKGAHYFTRWDREDQLQAFFAWLPQELHDAPGIDWTTLAPEMMGYLIKIIGNGPDATVMAVVAASVNGAMDERSQLTLTRQMGKLLQNLRATTPMHCLADLKQEQIWHGWAVAQEKKATAKCRLDSYIAVSTGHFLRYLRRLTPSEQQRMQCYALPPLSVDFAERYFPSKQVRSVQRQERKATTDILVPLYPILRQLVRLRKQLAERTLLAIREACCKVDAGEESLPYSFQHTDVIPEVNRDARSVADIRLQGREIVMKLVLWDKRTWVIKHPDRYCDELVVHAQDGKKAYDDERNCFFVQVESDPYDFLWFGDLVEQRVLRKFATWNTEKSPEPEDYQSRWKYARNCGFSNGCTCDRPGLLTSGNRWFSVHAERSNELLIEFESLYRGVLFGSALAMLALSNGSRMAELLQVSMDKERRITRTETVLLLGDDGLPQMGENGQPLTKQVKLHFQHLLPKGAKTDEERQLFPLSKEALRLLEEIKHELTAKHGEIPVVAPARSNTKREHLKPERYLFQWDALPDEGTQSIGYQDAQTLLRFMLHGLDLYTAQGQPIRVAVHVLRHVMSTHARHYRHVPPEVIAHFFLHHRLRELTGRAPSLPEISEYYTLMTEEQRFAVIRADLDEQEEMDHMLLAMIPKVVDLEQKNEAIQAAYEIWHALHPTAFGYCSCPGLCPREQDRSLCLGCVYLVEDPEKLGAALVWHADYARQAALFEVQGNAADARQARIKVQLLDDMINVMRMQLEEETGGRYIPVFKVLPSPHRQLEAGDETES